MDGPLADFDLYCQIKKLDPQVAKKYSGTYLNLAPTTGSIEAVEVLTSMKNLDVFVLTKIPSENHGAATEKHIWLERYFPTLVKHLIISPDKGCVGTKRDFLIDDHPEWANAHNFSGEIITFQVVITPHAAKPPGLTWPEILEYISIRLTPH
jgi:5'(3')-deoxyribonucleotidase